MIDHVPGNPAVGSPPESMPRFFTLQQAQSALPKVEQAVRDALFHKTAYQKAEAEMNEISRNIVMTGGMSINRDRVIQIKETRETSGARLKELFEQIQSVGCLIKDLDVGLLDFPTLYKGEEVYLCWRLGETRIEFWHGVRDGFAGRKPIDDDFMASHRGDTAS